MRKSVMVIAAVAMCCVWLAGSAEAMPRVPFVEVSVSPKVIHLDQVMDRGLYRFEARATVRVVANCAYQVEASFSGFKKDNVGRPIRDSDLSVSINGTVLPVGKRHAVIKKSSVPTPYGGVDVPLELKFGVGEPQEYAAGSYGGTLTLTIMGTR